MPNDMTRQQWTDSVSRQLARTMPDMYPEGYSRFLAEQYAEEGGYDKYVADKYAPGLLWEPPKEA